MCAFLLIKVSLIVSILLEIKVKQIDTTQRKTGSGRPELLQLKKTSNILRKRLLSKKKVVEYISKGIIDKMIKTHMIEQKAKLRVGTFMTDIQIR